MPRYNFEVIIRDGVGTVLHPTQGMEDGTWSIGGSFDEFGAGINVTHRRMTGQYVVEAQHFSNPENYKAPEIPGLDQLKATFISMGYTPAEAERYAMQSLASMNQTPPPPTARPEPQDVPLNPDTGHPWTQSEAMEHDGHKPIPRHIHEGDGSVEGCPACFPGARFPRETDMRRRGDIRD